MTYREPVRFFNRELSWIEFNARVLEQARRSETPLLERMKFLSIVSSNFDEFFMVRMASLKRQFRQGNRVSCPSGLSPSEQLDAAEKRIRALVEEQYHILLEQILPGLEEEGLICVRPGELSEEQLDFAGSLFSEEIFPALTPVREETERPFPFTANLRMYVAFLLRKSGEEEVREDRIAIVQVPPGYDRIIWLPCVRARGCFLRLEDLILSRPPELFPGFEVEDAVFFRVTRDADLGVDEERDEDFLEAMEEVLQDRLHGFPVRLEVSDPDSPIIARLKNRLNLDEADVYPVSGPLDLASLMDVSRAPGFDHLKYPRHRPVASPYLPEDADIWTSLRDKDVLLHHPYESFEPIIRMVKNASADPAVMAIKMTLYRTSSKSPVIRALKEAAELGKQVTVLVEVKARFDEERNIGWAQELERSGIIVVYGIARLKVHSKALLIVRKEPDGIVRYLQMGTGNYNEKTARLYTDYSFLTTRSDLTYEASLFFNAITGYSSAPDMTKLAMAPTTLKPRLLRLIKREAERATPDNPGLIMAKLNSLGDPEIIEALYEASAENVRIYLNVRGICMLVPGKEGLSENIRVVSIVGRFLEHSRIVYFNNGGEEELYLSSADWLPRNLDRRVELFFPIENSDLVNRLKNAFHIFFSDTTGSWELLPDGNYRQVEPKSEQEALDAQSEFVRKARRRAEAFGSGPNRDFEVRRKPPE
ncbi:MAG: polyphosphate kinase 1 [Spirochaetales bacterium]|nr:polyphosphate kinase 1 [Spirochaetales bacterium]MCF7938272.1 polyphosphate kinase 1 [Spirochaetales bacterium]